MASGWTGYVRFMDSLERLVVRVLVGMAVLMVVLQAAMLNPGLRRIISITDRLEGVPYSEYTGTERLVGTEEPRTGQGSVLGEDARTISIELVGVDSLPGAELLVNGRAVADFDYPVATVEVKPYDLVEIRCRRLAMPVGFRVRAVSRDLSAPREGDVYEGSDRVLIGRVGAYNMVKR